MTLVADTKLVTDEMMGVAWWSRSGREDDDETVELSDSSTALVWSPTTKAIVTMQQRSGEKTLTADDPTGRFFTEYTEQKRAVPPHDSFASLSVVFKTEPIEKVAYEVLIDELRKAVTRRSSPIDVMAFAHVGSKENPAGRRQIKGSSGFVDLEYRPSQGNQIIANGRSVGPAVIGR